MTRLEDVAAAITSRPDFVLRIFDATSAPVLAVCRRGSILYCNKAAALLAGYARHQLIGESVEMLVPEAVRALHEAHRRAYFRDPIERTMGAAVANVELRNVDGELMPVQIELRPIEVADGVFVVATIYRRSERPAEPAAR